MRQTGYANVVFCKVMLFFDIVGKPLDVPITHTTYEFLFYLFCFWQGQERLGRRSRRGPCTKKELVESRGMQTSSKVIDKARAATTTTTMAMTTTT